VALSAIVMTNHISLFDLTWVIGILVIVITSWFLIGYFLFPPFLKKIARYASLETITVVSVGLCLFLVVIANYFHYSSALGAFMMGSILAESAFIDRLTPLIEPIRDIFAAVFFIAIGMLIEPSIITKEWPIILLITIVTIAGKILSTGICAFLSGQTLNTSLRSGFAMAQIGEFSFIIAGLGLALDAINEIFYPIIVAVSVITTFTTPYSIRISDYLVNKIHAKLSKHAHHKLNAHAAYIDHGQHKLNKMYHSLKKTIVRLIVKLFKIK
jgi:CPA2 family monovalent cation:H+ antiporter-2